MTPLTLIYDWFRSADDTIRLDMVNLAAAYHPTANADYLGDTEELIARFESYMTEDLADRKETVQRTFFLKSLLEACMAGRDTEAGWETVRARNEAIFTKMESTNPELGSQMYERFMSTYEDRKSKWIAWSSAWNDLIHDKLRYDNVYYYGIRLD